MVALSAVATALEKNDFKCQVFPNKKEAADWLLAQISPGDKVGFGGSMTLRQLDLPNRCRNLGAEVISHWEASPEEKADLRALFLRCFDADFYLTSANAVTEEGYLFNVDGNGNRVAATIYGPRHVFFVVGKNKVVPNLAAAETRLGQEASPRNNQRLDAPNPCRDTGRCCDCRSPHRSCRVYTVMKRAPFLTDITVLLIDEELGY
jgi:hypothetical protein